VKRQDTAACSLQRAGCVQADLPAVRQVLVGYPFPMADTGDVCNFPVYGDEAELPEQAVLRAKL
jgi:hypothetical protein